MNKLEFYDILHSEFTIDGPRHRGAEMPPMRKEAMNEANYLDGLRYKEYNTSYNSKEFIINYSSQETTRGYEGFMLDLERVIKHFKYMHDFKKEVRVKVIFAVRGEEEDTIVTRII